MAARTSIPSLEQQERTRAAIKTTQLVKRLQAFALEERAPNSTDDAPLAVDIDATRLRAIEILLKKSLPDLSSVTLTGDPNAPVALQTIRRVIYDPKA